MNNEAPSHAFLDEQTRRYLVKSLDRTGEWRYDVDMLVSAGRRAAENNDHPMAEKSDGIRRGLSESMRKAQDHSWQPVMPMQYANQFQHEAGRQDEQSLAGTEFFEPIATDSGSSVSTTANMRQFRRHNDGSLDMPAAIDAIVNAWSAMVRKDALNPIERALLEVLYPGQMDLMDPFAAEMLVSISDEEKDTLKDMSESKIKEIVGWRNGNPKLLHDSSFGNL